MKRSKNINASEIRQWCFCPRQWYLLRTTGRKVVTFATKRGVDFHLKESRKVEAVKRMQLALGTTLIIGGIVCCILFLSYWY